MRQNLISSRNLSQQHSKINTDKIAYVPPLKLVSFLNWLENRDLAPEENFTKKICDLLYLIQLILGMVIYCIIARIYCLAIRISLYCIPVGLWSLPITNNAY